MFRLTVSRSAAGKVSGGNGGGVHPFPFRTRKLSSPAPTILDGQLSGKIGSRQIIVQQGPPLFERGAFFCLSAVECRYA